MRLSWMRGGRGEVGARRGAYHFYESDGRDAHLLVVMRVRAPWPSVGDGLLLLFVVPEHLVHLRNSLRLHQLPPTHAINSTGRTCWMLFAKSNDLCASLAPAAMVSGVVLGCERDVNPIAHHARAHCLANTQHPFSIVHKPIHPLRTLRPLHNKFHESSRLHA